MHSLLSTAQRAAHRPSKARSRLEHKKREEQVDDERANNKDDEEEEEGEGEVEEEDDPDNPEFQECNREDKEGDDETFAPSSMPPYEPSQISMPAIANDLKKIKARVDWFEDNPVRNEPETKEQLRRAGVRTRGVQYPAYEKESQMAAEPSIPRPRRGRPKKQVVVVIDSSDPVDESEEDSATREDAGGNATQELEDDTPHDDNDDDAVNESHIRLLSTGTFNKKVGTNGLGLRPSALVKNTRYRSVPHSSTPAAAVQSQSASAIATRDAARMPPPSRPQKRSYPTIPSSTARPIGRRDLPSSPPLQNHSSQSLSNTQWEEDFINNDPPDTQPASQVNNNRFRLPNGYATQIADFYAGQSLESVATPVPGSSIADDLTQFMPHRDTQQLNPLRATSRAELAARFRYERTKGNEYFARFIYSQEIACSTLRGADAKMVIYDAAMCLDTVFDEIVEGLIDGDLPTKLADPLSRETEICNMFHERASETRHPGIYLNSLTDDRGHSPKWQHLWNALQDFKRYCVDDVKNNGLSYDIDRQMRPHTSPADSHNGYRKYLDHEDTNDPIRGRRQKAGTFAANLERALLAIDEKDRDRDDILFDILVELGYSGSLLERLIQHAEQESSNFLMNLFEACLVYRNGPKYKVRQHIIHLIAWKEHRELSEILLTRIGQGYVTSGTGFSHYPAGRSVPWTRTSPQEARDFQWVFENSPVQANQKKALRRIKQGTNGYPTELDLPDGAVGDFMEDVYKCVMEDFC
ncbi:unnamed protein product [Zymoseptoria tritici ST99CH_1A5]|uniref:Uncharacterized protein n=1 Tax=Zymoseptoria tritici ST99CH_1A5 TaxID=1276529 RepID=A0A1Y6LKX3_ZYMTR|nr:unnamed protein product [Zymoseptoria tritici ST99CH_1A5]